VVGVAIDRAWLRQSFRVSLGDDTPSGSAHDRSMVRRAQLEESEDDPTIYPEEEKVGEESLQRFILEALRPLVERWLEAKGVRAWTGADLFVYYVKHDSSKRVAPDILVLPGIEPGIRIRSWKTWLRGIVPSFAFEMVSLDVDKDYTDVPELYGKIGVPELIVFDPDPHLDADRVRWQVFRRVEGRGFVRVEANNGDRVRSRTLGGWLRVLGADGEQRIRIGLDPDGEVLFPTEVEAERAAKEAERAAKEELEREVARLRELLGKR
jgi:hypothetical protein